MALKNAFEDLATEATLGQVADSVATKDLRIARASLFGEQRIEYLGTAPPGSAETATVWTVKKFAYDGNGLISIVTAEDAAWTNRTNLF